MSSKQSVSHLSKQQKADLFLKESHKFRLGKLTTESPHPRTKNLSHLAKTDVVKAIELLKEVEIDALESVRERLSDIEVLSIQIGEVLRAGGRVFLGGCGATGRLSLTLETLWRESNPHPLQERVVSFMAGGDYALVRSIEKFEDFPEYGERQLRDLGFSSEDLLISITEGGETPFVIGATEFAAQTSRYLTYFLFCNPQDLLAATVERSKKVFENSRVESVSFATGPMALAGSTRLQASTVLMLAVGAALFAHLPENSRPVEASIDALGSFLNRTDLSSLSPLIEKEASVYASGAYCHHLAPTYGITVLTDTTERSPTFSLFPFENDFEHASHPSWTYLSLTLARSNKEAWLKLLHRPPRALSWEGFSEKYGLEKLYGFDFSLASRTRRQNLLGVERVKSYQIFSAEDSLFFDLDGLKIQIARPKDLLTEHLFLKCLLNICSTLVMGRLGRFENNLMLFVRPTNNKLIDRSIRYVQHLLENTGHFGVTYEEICREVFQQIDTLPDDQSIVMKTFEIISGNLEK